MAKQAEEAANPSSGGAPQPLAAVRRLPLPHGSLRLPAFLPDATFGVVRSVDSRDLQQCGVRALVMNTFHLMQRPGSSTVQALGGLHRMSGWPGPIVTDSGGFQAYSLIRRNPKLGGLSDRGLNFRPEGSGRKLQLTPEKTVQLQLSFGTDVVVCLDDCTHVDAPREVQEASVRRTVAWARRCKTEFERILEQRRVAGPDRPLIFAVVQGGGDRDLRRRCTDELLAIGFDGYGYGGWPLDAQGSLLLDLLADSREMVPQAFPMHALGVGHPANVAACARAGYDLFDSALPTRDARDGRLYAWRGDPPGPSALLTPSDLAYLYIADQKHIKRDEPVIPGCDCPCCASYSVGYLHHLFKMKDCLYNRLATLHNLRFLTRLMETLQAGPDGPY